MKKQTFIHLVESFDFANLFNQLGWDNDSGSADIATRVAQKSAFRILRIDTLPDAAERRKIETRLLKIYAEHILIFTDGKNRQIWLRTQRRPSGSARIIEVPWQRTQNNPCERLWQRASGMVFTLDEQENITIADVTSRVDANLAANAEKVSKKFYDAFKKQHDTFIGFIKGITDADGKKWYASLMLNRLMFCYFIQKRGFLDNNKNYLREKLSETKTTHGKDKFHTTFYRAFLLRLFHEQLNAPHTIAKDPLFGRIPYLNGGLFETHQLETANPQLDIPDNAFEKIFTFFDQWEWHLDTRPDASGNEINPDVLGYIFERYINDRAAMGAYYTKEDITEYIAKNCILPFLLEKSAIGTNKSFWNFLKTSGDTYIYPAIKHGTTHALPPEIAAGIEKVSARANWNTPAPATHALPTEIWRETIARRQRYTTLHNAISAGEIATPNHLITHNLNIRALVEDYLQEEAEQPAIRKFYTALQDITILDPTCGSGAFLFAALNILEPLYEVCLTRLETPTTPRIENLQHHIYKTIILRNLYGVDLMREATEIAKLRLFLKLVAVVEVTPRAPNLGLDPLPDIDFNIRHGNTLVGFVNKKHVFQSFGEDLFGAQAFETKISDELEKVAKADKHFKDIQLEAPAASRQESDATALRTAKTGLGKRLSTLNELLNKTLFGKGNRLTYETWLAKTQLFNWLAEFYEIITERGGFDVIIGNPPYVEMRNIGYELKDYKTKECGNLYGYCVERAICLGREQSYISMICPMSLVKMPTYSVLRKLIEKRTTYYSVFSADSHPGTLFEGVQQNLTIFVRTGVYVHNTYTTRFIRFTSEERPQLINTLSFAIKDFENIVGNDIEREIFSKLYTHNAISYIISQSRTTHSLCMKNTSGAQFKIFFDAPPPFALNGIQQTPSTLKFIHFGTHADKILGLAIFNSCLFNLWWCSLSDGRHITSREYAKMPCFVCNESVIKKLSQLTSSLMKDLRKKAKTVIYEKANGKAEYEQYFPRYSKPILDEIDTVLAAHYGFTEEELDYIINYDIKYRMGTELNTEDDA